MVKNICRNTDKNIVRNILRNTVGAAVGAQGWCQMGSLILPIVRLTPTPSKSKMIFSHILKDKRSIFFLDKVAGAAAWWLTCRPTKKLFVLDWHGVGHGDRQGGRQGGQHGGWLRELVNWAQTFSTWTLPDLRVFASLFLFLISLARPSRQCFLSVKDKWRGGNIYGLGIGGSL